MQTILVPLPGGVYDQDNAYPSGLTVFSDLYWLLDADIHHHREPCGFVCTRAEVLVKTITDDGGDNP